MEFGTIRDIKKLNGRNSRTDSLDSHFDDSEFTGDDFDFEPSEDATELDLDFDFDDVEVDASSPDSKLDDLLNRLSDIKGEIDDILAHFNVDSDEFNPVASFSDYEDDEFDIDSGLDDEFSFHDQFDDSELSGDDFLDQPESDESDFTDSEFDLDDSNSVVDDDFSDLDFGDDTTEEDENPDFQGNIRTVAGANLVYKRKDEGGTYEELWIYNVGEDISKESKIRRAILSGTDIPPNSTESDDGSQKSSAETVGNVQFLHILGLPN